MRVQYLGQPIGALVLLGLGAHFSSVGIASRKTPGLRRLRRLLPARTPLFCSPDLSDPALLGVLESARPDLGLCWFWPRRVPEPVLRLPRLGTFGVHPSLLPRWRGPDPTFWAIAAGDVETGVTLHQLDSSFDTGPILDTRSLEIHPGDTGWSLARRLDRPGLELLGDAFLSARAGRLKQPTPQPAGEYPSAPHPTEEQLAIRWQEPAEAIVRLVRAAAPQPGASALFGNQGVRIIQASVVEMSPKALRPGEAWKSEDGLFVKTGRHSIRLERVVLEETGTAVMGSALLALL